MVDEEVSHAIGMEWNRGIVECKQIEVCVCECGHPESVGLAAAGVQQCLCGEIAGYTVRRNLGGCLCGVPAGKTRGDRVRQSQSRRLIPGQSTTPLYHCCTVQDQDTAATERTGTQPRAREQLTVSIVDIHTVCTCT